MNIKFIPVGIVAALALSGTAYGVYSATAPKPAQSNPVTCQKYVDGLIHAATAFNEIAYSAATKIEQGDRSNLDIDYRTLKITGSVIQGIGQELNQKCPGYGDAAIKQAKYLVEDAGARVDAATD